MSAKPSKAFTKWLNRLNDRTIPWTEKDIIYFRKATRSLVVHTEAIALLIRFDLEAPFLITEAQSEKGRAYLLSKSLKLNGEPRKGSKLGERELDILRNLSHHELSGRYSVNHGGYWLPLYTAVSKSGESFEYIGTTYEQLQVVG